MIAYMTFLLILLILSYPVALIVTIIVRLFQLKKMIRDIYHGIDVLLENHKSR